MMHSILAIAAKALFVVFRVRMTYLTFATGPNVKQLDDKLQVHRP